MYECMEWGANNHPIPTPTPPKRKIELKNERMKERKKGKRRNERETNPVNSLKLHDRVKAHFLCRVRIGGWVRLAGVRESKVSHTEMLVFTHTNTAQESVSVLLRPHSWSLTFELHNISLQLFFLGWGGVPSLWWNTNTTFSSNSLSILSFSCLFWHWWNVSKEKKHEWKIQDVMWEVKALRPILELGF